MPDLIELIPARLGLAPFAFEKVTVGTSVVSLTADIYAPGNAPQAQAAFITVDTANIRVVFSAGTPSSTNGHSVAATSPIWLSNPVSIAGFRAVSESGTDATIQVTYYR